MAHEAKRRGLDGVVCGHIHKAEIREIDGVLYCNDGDWVESLTALAETFEGGLVILRAQDILAEPAMTAVDTVCHRAAREFANRRSPAPDSATSTVLKPCAS